MVNIVFGDSIAGNIKMANYYAELNDIIRADLKENLICFNHDLYYGDIQDNGIGKIRKNELNSLYKEYLCGYKRKWTGNYVNPTKNFKQLLKLIHKGETIRFWYSNNTHEFCGFCSILFLLQDENISNDRILYIKFPDKDVDETGKEIEYRGSGSFHPKELLRYVPTQRVVTDDIREYHIKQWEKALSENSKLRIVLNNEIISVDEDYFDTIIMNESKKLNETFNEAELVGNSLSKISISDVFVGRRVDSMITKGMFEVLQKAPKNEVFYRKVLKKK
ncbi:MAG: DUF1835 domain-containing protein [Clostridia bacterium]|nr:DUF1835 domain-containing protein [Clostridia bacterium]